MRESCPASASSPLVYVMHDESVLYRPVAPAEVMYAQLMHLADLAAGPNISVQVVPYAAGGHIGLLGAFTIAEMADMSATVFLENAADGQTVEDIDHVSQIVAQFDALRGDALTVGQSRDLIVRSLGRRGLSSFWGGRNCRAQHPHGRAGRCVGGVSGRCG